MNIDPLLLGAKSLKASDVHLVENQPAYFRVNNDLKPVNMPPLSHQDMRAIVKEMMPTHLMRELETYKGADFSYQIGDEVRFRCVAYFEGGGKLGMVMRVIVMTPPSLEELELPETIRKIAENVRGMVLVTGMTGSGKSTTLAAMIQYINTTDATRIITVEDPVEYVYKNQKSVISQREVGRDVSDFNTALRQALRMDPDIILVGEMRDVETIRVAIKAAETGHLLFSTLHTTSATHTIQRILGYFPENEHDLLREALALNCKASITQRLCKRATGGRVACLEIMVMNPTISKLLKENRIPDINGVMKSREDGMQTFDQALADLVRLNKITFEEGASHCEDFYAYKRFIAGIKSTGDGGGILA
jgi:twitching motility protein PilT